MGECGAEASAGHSGNRRADAQPLSADWLPTASLEMLQRRAELLRATRAFFDARGYFEVDTPLLSADIAVDAWLEPFVCDWLPDPTRWSAPPGQPRFLQTSPEFAMKRLLAAGAVGIYQLGKAFRNGETGRRHNPEFTLLEWYRVGDDHFAQMNVVEEYVRALFNRALRSSASTTYPQRSKLSQQPFERLAYDDAFAKYAGQPVLGSSLSGLHALAANHGLSPPPGLASNDRDGWLNWLLAELVEPHLGIDHPVFLWGYPASQAALAQTSRRADGIPIAHRFELYIDGIELCNGYHELLDPQVLRERLREQLALRAAAGLRPLPSTNRLLAAMEHGLPPCAGVALGFDRLMMLAVGATTIEEVIAFPFARA